MTETHKEESLEKAKRTISKPRTRRTIHKKANDIATDSASFTEKKTTLKYVNSPKDNRAKLEMIEKQIDSFFESNKESGIRKLVSATKLMEANVHHGLPAKLWNPKMKPFIHPNRRNKTQIIDVLKTLVYLDRAYNFLRDVSKEGGTILLVGTRGDIVKEHIKNEAKRTKCFYVNQRWLGGTLTNFRTISNSINKLNKLISLQLSDEIKKYAKKEQVMMAKETERMNKFLGGIRLMRGLPQVIVVTDPIHEHNAIMEAKKMHIPIVAFANTNANPDLIDFIIPANSSSIRTVWLLTSIMCDAIADANGEPLSIVGKKDEEIILPEVVRAEPKNSFLQHKRFTRGGFTRRHPSEKPSTHI